MQKLLYVSVEILVSLIQMKNLLELGITLQESQSNWAANVVWIQREKKRGAARPQAKCSKPG